MRLLQILAAALGVVVAGGGAALATPATERLHDAEAIYGAAQRIEDRDARLARFHQAMLAYQRIADGGVANADLHVNIGNAALQAERLGEAVLHYRRALALDPDHARARQNLAHVRSLLPPWVPRPQSGGVLDTFFFWHRTLSRSERALASAVSFALAVLLVAGAVLRRRSLLRNLALLPAAGWAVLVVSLLLDGGRGVDEAVIVTPGGEPALASNHERAPAAFSNPLPEGTELRIVERREGWLKIRLADLSRDAWIRSGAAVSIALGNPGE